MTLLSVFFAIRVSLRSLAECEPGGSTACATVGCGSTGGKVRGSRDGRDPFLRIHKVTPVSRAVYEIPATVVGILRQSCEGAFGGRRTVPSGTLGARR